jgi:cytochrome c553
MFKVKIVQEDWEVDSRLVKFGVTRDELILIVEAAVSARADAVPHDPNNAGGLFSWIYGTRTLRDVFAAKGWLADNTKNVPSIHDPKTGTKIIFQNTDSACDDCHPKAVAGKGMASEEIVSLSTAYLFADMEERRQKKLNGTVWFLCVYANGDDVRAELSLPKGIKGRQFSGFIERIFVLKHGEWPPAPTKKSQDTEVQDFDIPVTRK